MPRNQYFKPHTANAKRFLHNAEFINRQIKIHNASIECISSFLGIEGKEFSKLLRYFSKPRKDSIKNFIQNKLIKQNLILRLHKNLKSSLKLRWDNEHNDKNDERLFLLENFNERLVSRSEKNFKLSTINTFNIRRILRVYLDYTWRKWKQRAPKWIGNCSNKRKLFVDLNKNWIYWI